MYCSCTSTHSTESTYTRTRRSLTPSGWSLIYETCQWAREKAIRQYD
uniref:Uncharacterized protein n=1 Tax=Arundo donax TaxID=35708 RepID=A0A0A9AEK2_ARUDO